MDYMEYRLSREEKVKYVLLFFLLDGVISYLFYRSVIAFLVGMSLFVYFLKEVKKNLCRKRQEELAGQFLMGMRAVSTSLTAGYSVEQSFEDALKELQLIYQKEDMIILEFQYIVNQLKMNRNLEELLLGLAARSGIDDIRNFAEIFSAAKRTGGNLIAIIRNTIHSVGQKEETRKEIQTALSSKKLEQNIMSLVPCLILIYIQMVSPGFMDGMYHNLTGIVIMTICLGIYAGAFFWGRKIVEIEV